MDARAAGSDAFQGVILAAGKGRRIQPFSASTPKPLLPVLDRPMIVWQVEALRSLGIHDVVVVVGHLGHRIVQALGDGHELGVRIRYVEQGETLGIAHAVAQLEPHLDRPFLLFLGDIFFETDRLSEMLEIFQRGGIGGVLAVKEERDTAALRRNFTVELGVDGFVRRVIEKPRQPSTTLKGCGLYLFDLSVFDAVRRTPRTALRDEYELTESIQVFVDDGGKLAVARVIQSDLNLSEPADLLALNLHVLGKSGRGCFIAPDAVVAPDASVDESIVMSGARVEPGARLVRSLVMPGERVPRGEHRHVIFVGGDTLVCPI